MSMSMSMTATTPIEYIGGANPPALPALPPIAPRTRTRKPVRIIGAPVWTDRAVASVVEIYRAEQRAELAGHVPAR